MRLIFLFMLLSSIASADQKSVIFFGGHGSNQEQIDRWVKAAQKIPGVNSEFTFSGILYPSKSASKDGAIRDGKIEIERIVREINNGPADKEYILVGHSSGSALASEVASLAKNSKRIKLVILDGFRPSEKLQSTVSTKCWSARSATQNDLKGLNYEGMKDCVSFDELLPYGCQNSMCLHFSLINADASKVGVSSNNYKIKGYEGLQPNMIWLKDFSTPNLSKSLGAGVR
jgi:hypothetical protein